MAREYSVALARFPQFSASRRKRSASWTDHPPFPAECKALETAMGGNEPDPSVHSAYHTIGVRAYRVTDPVFAEVSVSEFESRFPNQRLFIERLRQNNKIVESTPETTIRQNDVLAIASRPRICYKKPKEEQTSSTSADCFSRRQLQKCYNINR